MPRQQPVAATSGNSHLFPSAKLGSSKVFPSHRRSSPVTAWYKLTYNYIIIIATFEELKQPLLVSGAVPVQCFENCFILFQIVITSDQQPACNPMIVICLINKVGDQFNN